MNTSFSRAQKGVALVFGAAMALSSVSTQALACACGCGIFDIGGFNYAPTNSDTGFSAWFRYSYMNQNKNYEGTGPAPAADNTDKRILTSFYTLGGQYMINHDWGVMAEVPLYSRSFTTTYDYDANNNPLTGRFNLNALGDIRIMGMYSGFSPDHSSGLIFGVKLPTGAWKSPTYTVNGTVYSYANGSPVYDRDTMPGTGSTDLLLGGYTSGAVTKDGKIGYLLQGLANIPTLISEGYRPGSELNVGAALTYDLDPFAGATRITPMAQVLGSFRLHDVRDGALSYDSGYQRLLAAPALDLRFGKFKLYMELDVPFWQHVNYGSVITDGTSGQLVASVLYKVQVGYDF